MYSFLKILARISIPFYFYSTEILGRNNIPPKGQPIIITPNHQNAFIDAIVIAVYFDRPIYFLARASVFQGIFNFFLRSINMRPVFRIRDGYENLEKNTVVFKECSDILNEGKALLVFPEADHGPEYYLRSLSRGVPKIAVLSQENTSLDIKILPVGINYTDHFKSGGKMMLNFGQVLSVQEYSNNANESLGKVYNEIRVDLANELSQVMLIPNKTENYEGQKDIAQKYGRFLTYSQLKDAISAGDRAVPFKSKNYVLKICSWILTVPNLPFYVFSWCVLKMWVPKLIFHASIKYALIMLLAPFWVLAAFISTSIIKGFGLGILVVFLLLFSGFMRTRLIGFAR